ncbi:MULTISPECIES: glutathione S-transferase family protein [Psychrobacter]|uniref:glutathione S-transferase family protein n=1 Tax=Psychrobacter TaxID=497 RepID=UPI003FCF7723
MRLYYHPVSACSRRVLMVADHLNIKLDLVSIDLFNNEQNSAEFLKMNPNHSVPVLEDGEFVLWESYAIMQYLAELTTGQTIYPSEPRARADINRWLFWCGQYVMPGMGMLNWENAIKTMAGMGEADPKKVAHGEQLIITAASILESQLENREWICDTGLSLADFAIAAPLADQHSAKLPIVYMPNIQRWLEQVQALDSQQ